MAGSGWRVRRERREGEASADGLGWVGGADGFGCGGPTALAKDANVENRSRKISIKERPKLFAGCGRGGTPSPLDALNGVALANPKRRLIARVGE